MAQGSVVNFHFASSARLRAKKKESKAAMLWHVFTFSRKFIENMLFIYFPPLFRVISKYENAVFGKCDTAVMCPILYAKTSAHKPNINNVSSTK